MRTSSLLLGCTLLLSPLIGDDGNNQTPAERLQKEEGGWPSFGLIEGLGHLYHPVSTKSAEAQAFFNQGLTCIYAFNHDAAYQSFLKAAENDPKLAMAYWGMALSLGQNINSDITLPRELHAYKLIQKALTLLADTTENEQMYVRALAVRYSEDPKGRLERRETYRKAMKKVCERFPQDLDAATLYAESIMNIIPWHLWDPKTGKPAPETPECIEVLESVLQRDPMHIGANHYYIHAVEASPHPEYGLMSAERLRKLLPASGHFLHMPSHIYIRTGDYDLAVQMNKEAVAADKEYIRTHGLIGNYPMHYLTHNYFFLCRAQILLGQFEDAYATANELYHFYAPHFSQMPDLEYYLLAPTEVLLCFQKWREILDLNPPAEETRAVHAFWHFARASANLSLGRFNEALQEENLFAEEVKKLSKEATLGYNPAKKLLDLAGLILEAKYARMKGNLAESEKKLQQVIDLQDALSYNEPPDWFYSVRAVLGATYLLNKKYEDSIALFNQALSKAPRDGRGLYGLLQGLKATNQTTDAFWIEESYKKAWKDSTTELSIEKLLD